MWTYTDYSSFFAIFFVNFLAPSNFCLYTFFECINYYLFPPNTSQYDVMLTLLHHSIDKAGLQYYWRL